MRKHFSVCFKSSFKGRKKPHQMQNPPNCYMNTFATAAAPTEAEPLGKLYNHVTTVETFSENFKSSPLIKTAYNMSDQETRERGGSWKDPTHTYWALETSILSVDAASGEPHIGFLKQKWKMSFCTLLTDSRDPGLKSFSRQENTVKNVHWQIQMSFHPRLYTPAAATTRFCHRSSRSSRQPSPLLLNHPRLSARVKTPVRNIGSTVSLTQHWKTCILISSKAAKVVVCLFVFV